MCIKWILDKMGQFRTYNDINLSNRLVRAQQDLTELKANQKYLMNSVRGFEVPRTSKIPFKVADNSQTPTIYGLRVILTFTGNKPSKNVIFYPDFTLYRANGQVIDLNDLSQGHTHCVNYGVFNGGSPNVMKGFLDFISSSTVYGQPSLVVGGVANDVGILTIEVISTYDY